MPTFWAACRDCEASIASQDDHGLFRRTLEITDDEPLMRASLAAFRAADCAGAAASRVGAVLDRTRHNSLVIVHPVDPRDQTSEVDAPRYRLNFWHGSDSDEYEITGADVSEVLAWADRSAAGRTYSLWACLTAGDEAGVNLVRLAGWDPPAGDVGRPDHAVTIPASDKA